MKTIVTAIPAVFLAGAAFAQTNPFKPVAVPEISALEGTAALAAVAAIVLLAWERSRRSA